MLGFSQLLVLMIALAGKNCAISATDKCPSGCKCRPTAVICRKASLHTIPRNLPRTLVLLDLSSNNLKAIQPQHLRMLRNLESIILADNLIHHIDKRFFDGFTKLRHLSLANNRLSSIPILSGQQLPRLSILNLSFNMIETLDHSFIWSLPNLVQLNLANNLIQSPPSHRFFDHISKSLQTLHIDGNPINCDCRWIPVLHRVRILVNKSPHCLNPDEMHGRALFSLSTDELQCSKPLLQVSNDGLTDIICNSTEHPTILLNRSEQVSGSWLKRFDELQLDLSELQCAINYNLSNKRHKRQDHAPPQFTLKPKDRSFREGSTVRLDCEVIGVPRPSVEWFFKEKKLKRSRKYEMNYEQTNLIIYPFLERDVGTYKCVAENSYGHVEALAALSLISSSPPVISDPPESQTVTQGSTVKFSCHAQAEPRPFITWFFDGSEISMLRGHFEVSDDQATLTITNVGKSDDGVYSCMAGNTVGSMTAEARLNVIEDRKHYSESVSIDQQLLHSVVQQASENVNSAIDGTREQISKLTSPRELMRWFQFSFPQTIDLNRAREIYEESIRLIQKHVEKGLVLPLAELPTNVSFESVLARSHIDMLMQLAGCSGAQSRDPCDDPCFHHRYRTYDGQCNNLVHTMWGVSQTSFRRLMPPIYENGFNNPVGWDPNRLYFGYKKPNARTVSRKLLSTQLITPHEQYSSMLMQWGQFIDHDLDFIATAISRQAFATGAICNRTCDNINPCFNIQLPDGDPRFHKSTRHPCIEFERSSAVCGSGETSLIYRRVTYREQMNIVTSYIDGSGIYGSNGKDAHELRDLNPDRGLLRFDILSVANKPYLPFEKDSMMDCRRNYSIENPVRCFLAGDFRANEQLGLISMHTIWLREHNRVAIELARLNPSLDGETIYHEARKIVGAQLQHITFNDWLPKILGQKQFDELIGAYRGYHQQLDASISNAFATAAFRFGHTLINPILYRYDEQFSPIDRNHISLGDAFFAPEEFLAGGGVDPLLRGLFASAMKKPTSMELMNTVLTEKLFNRAHQVSLDLAAMNIQRGRDHALPGYTEYRRWCNLSPVDTWDDMMHFVRPELIEIMRNLYGHPGNIDLFVGGIIEERQDGALIGPTFSCIIAEQFRRIRDGDRFWYERQGIFTREQLQEIRKTSLAKVLCDNADNIQEIQSDVFLFPGNKRYRYNHCSRIRHMDLRPWLSCCEHLCPVAWNRYRTAQRR